MNPRLRRIPIQSPTIRIPRQSIHHGPTDRAVDRELETQIIMRSRYGMIVLVDDEVVALGVFISAV